MANKKKITENENPKEENKNSVKDAGEETPEKAAEPSGDAPKENKKQKKDAAKDMAAELAAEKDKYLRLAAEYDNFRKRSQKEREALFSDVKSDTILKLLPVYDNLERALNNKCSDEAFFKGVEMTMTQLKDILASLGVTEIPAVGTAFDPSVHNAVMHVEDDSLGENQVVEEFQKGFKLGDKVIRFSMVKVAN